MTWLPNVAGMWFSTTALNACLVKLLDPNSQMTIIEHNSLIAYIAMLQDQLAGPAEVAAAGNVPYRYVDIYGSALPPDAPAGTATERVPLYGVLPKPTDSERILFYDMLSDVIERLDYHDAALSTIQVNAKPTDATWIAVAGDAQRVVYQSWEYDPATIINEPRDLAVQLPKLLLASFTFGTRLQQQALGNTTTTATTTTAVETEMRPQVQALADSVRAADKGAFTIALATAAGQLVATAGIGIFRAFGLHKVVRRNVRSV